MPTPTVNSGLELPQLIARGERVFPCYPQVARYYPAAAIEDARRRLTRTIDRGDGPGLVIGAAGTGKSLLLQVLAAQYQERFDVVLLACARICTRRALLQAILFELGLPYRLRDEGQLRLSLLDHLLSADESPAGLLLLVDEAQALSVALLDELRVMTNLVHGGTPRVRVVLAGSTALEESFAQPDLESFSQRLSSRCYLAPFNREQTCEYIRAQVAAAGGAPDLIFTGDAASAVFDATDGVPRLVAQLCDRALLLADETKLPAVDRDVIQASWADLQQLPAPWDSLPQRSIASPSTNVIEFGNLMVNTPAAQHEADIEPTELDVEEDVPAAATKPDVGIRHGSERAPGDPFAEEFDEEEVVLDGFAAWDEMFHRATPRVENRRDPQFTSLVQAAIDAAPAPQTNRSLKLDVIDVNVEEIEEIEDADVAANPVEDPASVEPPADWPPLRLAVVSDPAPLKPIPLVAPMTTAVSGVGGTARAFDPVFPESAGVAHDWPDEPDEVVAHPAPKHTGRKYDTSPPAAVRQADPILIIEDDSPAASTSKPSVCREEYRHLFSRLRSG